MRPKESRTEQLRQAKTQLVYAQERAECGKDFLERMDGRKEVKRLQARVARLTRLAAQEEAQDGR